MQNHQNSLNNHRVHFHCKASRSLAFWKKIYFPNIVLILFSDSSLILWIFNESDNFRKNSKKVLKGLSQCLLGEYLKISAPGRKFGAFSSCFVVSFKVYFMTSFWTDNQYFGLKKSLLFVDHQI